MTSSLVAVALGLLLLVNVAWSIALHRRLSVLDRNGEQLDRLIREFDAAVARASGAVAALREEVGALERDLRRYGEGARLRIGQLERLCATAERLATRLDATIERARQTRSEPDTEGSTMNEATPAPKADFRPRRSPAESASTRRSAGSTSAEFASDEVPGELRRLFARLR